MQNEHEALEEVNQHLERGAEILRGIIEDIKKPINRGPLEKAREELENALEALKKGQQKTEEARQARNK